MQDKYDQAEKRDDDPTCKPRERERSDGYWKGVVDYYTAAMKRDNADTDAGYKC